MRFPMLGKRYRVCVQPSLDPALPAIRTVAFPMALTCGDLIKRGRALYGEQTALIFEDRRYTFAEQAARIFRLANALLANGLRQPGARCDPGAQLQRVHREFRRLRSRRLRRHQSQQPACGGRAWRDLPGQPAIGADLRRRSSPRQRRRLPRRCRASASGSESIPKIPAISNYEDLIAKACAGRAAARARPPATSPI